MKKTFEVFNTLLHKAKGVCVLQHEDRSEWVISSKLTTERFMDAVLDAINNALGDVEKLEFQEAESFDYGYKIQLSVQYLNGDGEMTKEDFGLSYASQY